MNRLLLLCGGVLGALLAFACWLGWQLLRQNGRILLRLDELEKRFDEWEFGESGAPPGLPLDSPAPEFELPDLAGQSKTLAEFRGQPVLLMFFNPACGFCRDLAPRLAAFCGVRRQAERDAAFDAEVNAVNPIQSAVTAGALQNDGGPSSGGRPFLLIIGTGDSATNRKLFDEHEVSCPVLLQRESEVATAYQAHGTPSGYLISAEGRIASELAMGAEALLALAAQPCSRRKEVQSSLSQPSMSNPQAGDQRLLTSATMEPEARVNRFSRRSLACSKIKRDGLKAGTPAPDFRLPRLDGQGDLTLSELRGKRVLLVFSDPHCDPCNELVPRLEQFHRENRMKRRASSLRPSPPGEGQPSLAVEVVMISRGEPKENRAKVKEHELTFPVVLQQQWEISRRYAMFATPIAYLIDEAGGIAHDVAVGTDAILELMARAERLHDETLEAASS